MTKEEPQEPKKMTVEEFKDWMEDTAEQMLAIEAFKEQNNALTKSNAALTEKLDAAREAAGKAIEDLKALQGKIKDLENRIEELKTYRNAYLEEKEENRKLQIIVIKMAGSIYK